MDVDGEDLDMDMYACIFSALKELVASFGKRDDFKSLCVTVLEDNNVLSFLWKAFFNFSGYPSTTD